MKKLLAGAAILMTATSAVAQQTAPPPPCQDELFRQFDFWVGEWDVYNPKGVKIGENSIKIEENGCLLVERWTGGQGGTGQSYNFVDLASMKWRQVWVSNWGTIDYTGGLNKNGAMVLTGEIGTPNADPAPFRGTWTLKDDGSVTQQFEQKGEDGKWAVNFLGIYRKKTD